MKDLMFLGLTIAFFVLSFGLVALTGRLMESR